MSPVRVLVADDHTLVRAGLRLLLDNLPGIEVVAEAGDGREVLGLVRSRQPDIVLMDVVMPGLNGLEAMEQVRKRFPAVRVIVLSMYANEEHVLHALQAGASGYLLKDAAPQELELAIRAVLRGESWLSPRISRQVIDSYLQHTTRKPHPLDPLTARQREILQLLAEGRSTREIAERLHLSVKTVETHRAQIMERLDIHDVAGLVRFAIRAGLVEADR